MPDHKEMGRIPTEREREVVFAPHESPRRQGDGDPGRKPRPRLDHDEPPNEKDKSEDQGDGAGS